MTAAVGGLTTAEAAARLAEVGPNTVETAKREPPWRMLLAELTHLLAVLLWVAAGLALLAGTPVLAVAIVAIVLLNAMFAFWQEYRADRSVQRLRELLPAAARVVRDGVTVTIPVAELVPGDLLMVAAGDRVGADLDVLDAVGLELDESLVTGESVAVAHSAGDRLRSGTFVVQGEGRAVVAATGAGTALAEIERLAVSAKRPPSPLTVELKRVVRIVAVIAAIVGVGLGAASLLLGLTLTGAFIFAIGVAVALIPEGLLPTVTLSLARGAETMAERRALVRRLDAVETLGATTFICTDKTGTLTQNRMNVVEVVTPAGLVHVHGDGYAPTGRIEGSDAAVARVPAVARTALRCVTGRVEEGAAGWNASGDPMEAAFHCLALRVGLDVEPDGRRIPYSADRMLSSSLDAGRVSVLGGTEAVFARCRSVPEEMTRAVHELTGLGRRVLAVASRDWAGEASVEMEHDLDLVGVLALEDPPREGVTEALDRCRSAGIRIAMITGDHPRTGAAIAREVGLLGPHGVVLDGPSLPVTDAELADALDHDDGVVVARATPSDKLRIARALRGHGHVVAMTGDGVNDAPALREADVGVAMGASGSDVAREAADLVLLDDHFATIVIAVELGRATFKNVRRFLTYHLTDNVAELAPFVVWALTGGLVPLAIGVLQVIALDIGSDMLPALALGAEPPRDDVMQGRRRRSIVDGGLIVRAFVVLGMTEAVVAMSAFLVILLAGGWHWGASVSAALLSTASGAAFAAIVLGQAANAFACRSSVRPVWRLDLRTNRLVLYAVGAQVALLIALLGIPAVASVLGGSWPTPAGWLLAAAAIPAVAVVDAVYKLIRRGARGGVRASDAPSHSAPGRDSGDSRIRADRPRTGGSSSLPG
ncbi:cation-translocating P-type ATPase [Microbacterium rhizosphaerae]|uniref:Cation-transporting P-type ATPase n=1 Tax=Microbacterium rhizosphaerae TaxID=1678237 RepID=A0ABZ0SGM7_9MICO|nr:cation-transporting P-type ATPase [Microbacterium rhizosphaerae]WPR88287.1 cation-transporting P-type ATPase [Microbacterium rhizosphaerae]